ncbi:MAG: hypothetical protein ACK4MQ_03095 [Hyphomonas sp.]
MIAVNERPLERLITNHAVIAASVLAAMALPIVLAGGLDSKNPVALGIGTALAQGALVFWHITTYVLLQPKWSSSVVAYAIIVPTMHLALALFLAIGMRYPATFNALENVLTILLLSTITLHFITIALNAEKISKTAWGRVGYFFMMFYFPFCLSLFANRLRANLEAARLNRDSGLSRVRP